MALTGAGQLIVRTKDLTVNTTRAQELVLPLCVASFELTFEDQLAEAKCLIGGKRQITSAGITESVASFNLTFEKIDFNTLGFAYDELVATTSSISFPVVKTATIPSGPTPTITDADVPATAGATLVYLTGGVNGGTYMTRVGSSPTAGQYSVSAGSIVFNTADAGKVVTYSALKSFSSVPTVGVESGADEYGALTFEGLLYTPEGNRYGIQLGSLTRVGSPSISITGDLAQLTIPFRAGVPTGWRKPFRLFNLTGLA